MIKVNDKVKTIVEKDGYGVGSIGVFLFFKGYSFADFIIFLTFLKRRRAISFG